MKAKMKTTIQLHPQQFKIFSDKHRFKVIRAGRRFGKSVLAVITLITAALETPGVYWFVAPFYGQAKEIAYKLLQKYLPAEAILKKNETDLSFELKNGSTIKLKGADNPDSLKGVGLNGCILDEFAFMRKEVWEEIIRPMLFDSGGWAMFISTPHGYDYFYDLWESVQDKDDWERWHFTTYQNPFIADEEIEEAKKTMSDERFAQEILAEFTKKTGTIWPMFSRDQHIKPRRNPKQDATIYGSIDFGFAIGHPTCVLWHEVVSEEILTFDGFMIEGKTIEQIDDRMRTQTQGLTIRGIYPDPARPDLIEELRKRNWPILETKKEVELGIAKVAEYMNINPLTNKPRWTISEHLKDIIRQIEEYEWQEVRGEDGQFKQAPKKENDDAPDSLRYFLYSLIAEQRVYIPPVELLGGGGTTKGMWA
jgi:hypothetical protein